ncbi:MAG TPA: hypothetical protein VF133_11690 [Terriglobales bacterium]
MKKAVLILSLSLAVSAFAQDNGSAGTTSSGVLPTSVTIPTEKVRTPTTADLYCAGFIGKSVISRSKFVAGGLESPFTTQFAKDEIVYLKGSGYEVGQQYSIVRELRDPNRYELFPGQWSAIKAAGQPFAELARIQVVDTRNKMAIAQIQYSCDTVLPGDYAIPYADKTAVEFHPPMKLDRFAPANGQVNGRIIMAKDFNSELGNGDKVYLNIGANQGLKVGDYLKAVRSYAATSEDPVESLSFAAATLEPTQARQPAVDPNFLNRTNGPQIHVAEMPRRAVGEIVIVGTTPTTATGMIVFSLEPVLVGDRVELDQQ